MNKIAFILLHGGENHSKSKYICKYLDDQNIPGITKICVGSNEIKQRILNNNKDITIKYIPSIIIYKGEDDIKVYEGTISNLRPILNQLREIIPNIK